MGIRKDNAPKSYKYLNTITIIMDLKEFQKSTFELLKKADAKQKGEHDTDTTVVHLLEELGEMAHQLFNEKIGRDKLDKENLAEEISDCMMLLSQLASNFDIDIEKSIKKKLKVLKQRFNV